MWQGVTQPYTTLYNLEHLATLQLKAFFLGTIRVTLFGTADSLVNRRSLEMAGEYIIYILVKI